MGAHSEEMLQQMLQVGTGVPRFSGGWCSNTSGCEVYCGSIDALIDMTSGGRGDIVTRNGGTTGIIGWLWVDYGADHNAQNTKLQIKKYEVWILRKSTNTWTLLWSTGVGLASKWNNSGNLGSGAGYSPAIDEGGGIYTPNRQELQQYALEYWPLGGVDAGVQNQSLMADCAKVHIRALVRQALINPGGTDDRASARFRCRQGWDFCNAAHPGHSGGQAVFGGDFTRPEKIGQAISVGDYTRAYPGYAMDGGSGRWILVPFDSVDPDRWYIISGSATQCRQITGLYGAWAYAAGVDQYSGSTPYGRDEPYVLTPAQFRANPPPDPDIGGTSPPPPEPEDPIRPGLPTKLRWFTKVAGKLQWGANGAATSAPVFLTESLAGAVVGTAYSATVQATGSPAPTYSVQSGSLPAGLSLNSTTGAITGTPTAAGTASFTIRATGTGTTDKAFSIVVTAVPSWITTVAPAASVGVAYSLTLSASGSTPISYSLVAGSLPAGLTLAAGVVSGTPTTAGTSSFTLRATNSAGSTDRAFTLEVASLPSITTTTLPVLAQGAATSIQLLATGALPMQWSVPLAQLPAGMSLSPLGVLSGAPTTIGTGSMTVTATNAYGSDSQVLAWSVSAAADPPAISTTTLADATQGSAYSQTLTGTGATPKTWAVIAGALPPGMTLNGSTGAITGASSVPGGYPFTVRLANAYEPAVERQFSIRVLPLGAEPVVSPWTAVLRGR